MSSDDATTDVVAPSELFDLSGKVALVTGTSSGLGERFARVLTAAGATVFGAARRQERLETLSNEIGLRPIVCDLSDSDACTQLVRSVYDDVGHIDILVNNAGVGGGAPAESQTAADFKRMLDVNLVAPFILAQQVVVNASAPKDISIVNVASIHGVVGSGRVSSPGYCAAKGGLVNLTRELAARWARDGVRVNALAPGWFETEATTGMFENEKPHAWMLRQTPMGRSGAANELDGAVLFLASRASTFMTGQVVVVDGGWTSV